MLNGEGLASFTWSELRGGRGDTLELNYSDVNDELKSMEIILHRSRIVGHNLVRYEPYTYIVPEDEATEHALNHVLGLGYDQLRIKRDEEVFEADDEDFEPEVPVKTYKKEGGGFVTLPATARVCDCCESDDGGEEENTR